MNPDPINSETANPDKRADSPWYNAYGTPAPLDMTPKSAELSKDGLRVPAFPTYINELGHVKAGQILKLIDIAAVIPSSKHLGPGYPVVTASLDRTNFINPIRRWEIITLETRLTRTWNTSMESQVTVHAWNFRTCETRKVATAYLVLVAMDTRRNKIQIPPLVPVTPEDEALAAAADLRKENRKLEGKRAPFLPIDPATDNVAVVERVMTTEDANIFNNVFGGVILEIIHEAGTKAAKVQFLGGTVVGVRQDRMSFLEPAFIGETIIAKAIVTKTWLTSMEVQVEVESMNPSTGQVRQIGSSYLVYVGLDPDGVPVQLPPWIPVTEAQKQRAEAADLRRHYRKSEEQNFPASL